MSLGDLGYAALGSAAQYAESRSGKAAKAGMGPKAAARTYKASPKHHPNAPTGVGRAPTNGQASLNNSVQVKPTSPRRVSVDPETGEFSVFDQTSPGEFHGHVRSWDELTPEMQRALIDAGRVTGKGKLK